MAGEKYWKISRVVMVIMSENIGFITSGQRNSTNQMGRTTEVTNENIQESDLN